MIKNNNKNEIFLKKRYISSVKTTYWNTSSHNIPDIVRF